MFSKCLLCKAVSKFVKCVNWAAEQEASQERELIKRKHYVAHHAKSTFFFLIPHRIPLSIPTFCDMHLDQVVHFLFYD